MSLKNFDQVDWIAEEAREFAEYWRGLPRESIVPHRRSFDPSRIKSLLPGIAMYEVKSGEEVVSRLAGTELVEFFGQEITGRNMLELWPDEVKGEASMSLRKMVEHPCGMILKIVGYSESGKAVSSIAVGFPLLDEADQCNRLVFFSCDFEEKAARVSREDNIKYLSVERSTFIDISS